MSGFAIFYLLCATVAGIGLIGLEAWDRRHNPRYEPMTLANLFQGLGLSLCPLVNMFAAIGVVIYFFGEIAPKVVLFGKKT